jgi:GMP synthase (glutamine-hydrolysing)
MPPPKRPFVRVLQHVAPEGPGRIAAALEARGIAREVTRIDLGEGVPKSLDGAAALVVMGGPMGVYEADRYPHLREERRLIERALRDGIPLLGVCLGSQLLAATLGARVYPGTQKEIGWFPVGLKKDAIADPLFASAPGSFWALHWHGDVFDLPADTVSLARSDLTEHQAFRFEKNAYGILFHVEANVDHVQAMAGAFTDDLARDGIDGAALVATARDMDKDAATVANLVFGGFAERVAELP